MDSWVEDQILIDRARAGDRDALDRLFQRHSEYVKSSIRVEFGRRLQARTEADDLLQETFLQAFRSIAQYRGQSRATFRSWLSSIARHVVQSHARRHRAQKADLAREVSLACEFTLRGGTSVVLGGCLDGDGETPSTVLRREERFKRLETALRSLSPDHRQVIQLLHLQGLSVKEAARRMRRSPNATSVLLFRALLKLKAAFGHTDSFHLPDRCLEE